ncbi:MAG: hypothetical protein V4858_04410 [Pseudomonadota bacterium]
MAEATKSAPIAYSPARLTGLVTERIAHPLSMFWNSWLQFRSVLTGDQSMNSQRSEAAQSATGLVTASVVVLCAALALMVGADVHARAGDRFRCIPADGGESYTSPGPCRSNTDTREPLTEQEKADAQATESRGRAFVRCTAADGRYSKFVLNGECPSATDIRTIEYAKQAIQPAREVTPPPESPATPLSPPAPAMPVPVVSAPASVPATLPARVSNARSGTGWVVKLGLLALVGLGIWGIFSLLGRRHGKAKAEQREVRAKAIARNRKNPASDKELRQDQPIRDRIDMQQKAQDFLAALGTGADVQGGMAFRGALQQSRLDYSMESLDRVDQLLSQVRTKFSPQRESWQNQPGADNFCLMLAFYLGEMISRQTHQPIKWHTREQAVPLMPADMPLPEASWSRVVGIIAASICVPLAVIEEALFGDSPTMTCKAFVEERVAKLPKPPAGDENERCAQMLEAFFNDGGILGTLAFREQLKLARLDYSLASLERLDQLLRFIRPHIKPPYDAFINNPDTQNFLRFSGFYIGMTVARVGATSVKWLDFAQAKKFAPELEFQFETSCVCVLSGRFYFPLGLVTEILLHPDAQRSVPEWANQALQVAPSPIPSILRSSVQSGSESSLDAPTALAIRKAGRTAAWSMFMVEGGSSGALTVFVQGEGDAGTFRDFSMYGSQDSAFEAAHSRMETNPDQAPFQVMSFDGYANLHTGRTDALTIELRTYTGERSSNQAESFTMSVACPYRNANDPKGFAIYSPKLLDCSAEAAMRSAIFKHFYLGIQEFKVKEFDWFHYLDERI